MKHAGSTKTLIAAGTASQKPDFPLAPGLASQSLFSRLVLAAGGFLLIALVADQPVRALAQSLDPSARTVLLTVTQLGNSAWPIGTCLLLLGVVEILRRTSQSVPADELRNFRSTLIFILASVAISGFLASLTKHAIGRIRPSTAQDAMVLEFSVMAFKSGWAAFPSGHATTATAAAVALALCFPRMAWAWLTIGLLVALSRALIGVHWLTDSLAGLALGTIVALDLNRRMIAAGHFFDLTPGTPLRVLASLVVVIARTARKTARHLAIALRQVGRNAPPR